LRAKLDSGAQTPKIIIRTVHGTGYMLVSETDSL
jgi:DNA-binding response OmpR family regulator